MSSLTPTGAWTGRDGRPGRLGVLFAAVWLVFLADAFRAAWDLAWQDEDRLRGWVGMLAVLAFAAFYVAAFTWVRRRRQRMVLTVEPVAAATIIGVAARRSPWSCASAWARREPPAWSTSR